ncbi:UPF0764 protein C16orf89 homolog [Schistocerca cancellata]|uniref:UPF0764 protein C16orf89 homolog n=1 Tax=Schistocerca cancellata TaxID=274614 RepID=UPI002119587F|nr:UPF0764 protein C16orf89 homolog [Schistocerca cancellata]
MQTRSAPILLPPLLLLLLLQQPGAAAPEAEMQQRALLALSGALAYLEGQSQALLDSVFAVAIADGQLQDMVEAARDAGLRSALQDLEARAAAFVHDRSRQLARVADHAGAQMLQLAQPRLWRGLGRHGASPLVAPAQPGALTASSLASLLVQRWPSEADSDLCLRGLLDGCGVSGGCWRVETSSVPVPRGYSTTHRLLFYSVAWRLGCANATSFADTDWGSRIPELCASILLDAEELAAGGYLSPTRDLFTEQIVLCGLEGFKEFIKPSWLEKILSWQRPFGCYGNLHNSILRKRRRKRTDIAGDYDCSMHFTGLAVSGITLFLRDMIETR